MAQLNVNSLTDLKPAPLDYMPMVTADGTQTYRTSASSLFRAVSAPSGLYDATVHEGNPYSLRVDANTLSAVNQVQVGGDVTFMTQSDLSNTDTASLSELYTTTVTSSAGWGGAKGAKGDSGSTGSTGDKGDTGSTGSTGDKGEPGTASAKGDKGNTGSTGAQGDKGETGSTGSQGAAGDKGDTGATGAAGDKGETGGVKGDKGETGLLGTTGAAGAKGEKGESSGGSSSGFGLSGRYDHGDTTKRNVCAIVQANSVASGAASYIDFENVFARSWLLMRIETDKTAWITFYTDTQSRLADASRTEHVDPAPGSGVIAEIITTGSADHYRQRLTPGVIGFNDDVPTPSDTMYAKVVNKAGTTQNIKVSAVYLPLEANRSVDTE